jgi:putative protease
VKRVVLPRILTVTEIAAIHREIPCEIEAFVFGNIGMMSEGRCSLTNYVTGTSTNMDGVCSPANAVHYMDLPDGSKTAELGDFEIDCFAPANTQVIRRFKGCHLPGAEGAHYAFEEPVVSPSSAADLVVRH